MADFPADAKMVRRELKSLEIILFLRLGTVKWQKVCYNGANEKQAMRQRHLFFGCH